MKKLDISITRAQLMRYVVELKEGQPQVQATIGLFTDGGKKISDYTIYTAGWSDETKFELPIEVLPLIGDTMRILEGVVVRHCRDGQLALSTGSPLDEPKPDDPVEGEVSDVPIDLSEIPF